MSKFLFAFAFLAAASAAQAATIKVDSTDAVVEGPTSDWPVNITLGSYKFEVNAELGRARLDISYNSDYQPTADDGGYYGPGEDDVLVQGLTFDKTASQVVFKAEDGRTTNCANVEITRNNRKVRVKATGLCTLTSDITDETTDDGWEIKHRKVLNVYLNVQN